MVLMDDVEIDDEEIGCFYDAKIAAQKAADEKLGRGCVLWSWHDGAKGRHCPPVDCCGDEARPAYEIYATSRGGRLKVSVNEGVYEFFFGPPSA